MRPLRLVLAVDLNGEVGAFRTDRTAASVHNVHVPPVEPTDAEVGLHIVRNPNHVQSAPRQKLNPRSVQVQSNHARSTRSRQAVVDDDGPTVDPLAADVDDRLTLDTGNGHSQPNTPNTPFLASTIQQTLITSSREEFSLAETLHALNDTLNDFYVEIATANKDLSLIHI